MPSAMKRCGHLPLYRWIKKLRERGLTYEIAVLEECSSKSELVEAERFHIAYLRSIGIPLLNLTEGGEGLGGMSPSAATRDKISRANKGRKHTVEARARMKLRNPSERQRLAYSRSQGGKPVMDIATGRRFDYAEQAARALGLNQSAVCAVLNGRRKQHKGHVFRWAE